LRPDATGAVLEAGWETFFTTLNVRLERGLEWRGGKAKLTFAPTFWVPGWQKAIDVRPRRMPGMPEEEARRWQVAWVGPAGVFVQYQQRNVLLIAGEPWPGRYHITPLVPADDPAARAPATVVPLSYRQTAFGVAPSHEHLWFVFGESPEAIAAALWEAEQTGQPARAPFLPLDLPWQVVGGRIHFPFSGEDPRVVDVGAGIFSLMGGLTVAEVAEDDTPLTHAYLAAHRRMCELGHEMVVGPDV
jgi:hypothetical protein